MARNLIKIELEQLKEKALSTEKDMINNLLDELQSKTGFGLYSSDFAEDYVLSDAVKKAISFIRENIKEILDEISKAQKEHDEAAGKVRDDAMNKITDRLNGLRGKLTDLSKKLLDKLTGRDKTADVYGGDAGLRYQAVQGVSDETYIISEMIKVAAEQLRERVFKLVEQIGEAKREAQKALREHKKVVQEHLDKLLEKLRRSLADLKDVLLGRMTADDINKDIQDQDKDDALYAVQLLSSENYVLDDAVRDLVEKLRMKILQVIELLGKAKREAQRAAGKAREAANEELNRLREELRRLSKDVMDAVLGRKNAKELEKDLEEPL